MRTLLRGEEEKNEKEDPPLAEIWWLELGPRVGLLVSLLVSSLLVPGAGSR